ncbi:hypothetical protein GB937_000040 [Aspergillus fischeri]|nr:hypothetical protein GB937_000040 [Aspergillus fischeri]
MAASTQDTGQPTAPTPQKKKPAKLRQRKNAADEAHDDKPNDASPEANNTPAETENRQGSESVNSPDPEPELESEQPKRRNRRTRRPQRDPDEQSETTSETAEQFEPSNHRERRRRPRRRDEQRIVPFGADSVGREVGRRRGDAGGTMDNISNVNGMMMGQDQQNQAQPEKQQKESKDNTLSLRLDLNLEIEVQLKARIHGDLTLSLL